MAAMATLGARERGPAGIEPTRFIEPATCKSQVQRPQAWNSLPEQLRQTTLIELFKRSLKTFLFGQIAR